LFVCLFFFFFSVIVYYYFFILDMNIVNENGLSHVLLSSSIYMPSFIYVVSIDETMCSIIIYIYILH
jgi:hypothetical protein